MKRLIILILCAITWAASAQAQVVPRMSWHYLRADANDTCRFVTNDKGDTLPVYFDGTTWVMGEGDSTHILNDVLVIGDSDTDCVYIKLFNGVDSTYFRLDSANGNLQYSNDYTTWNDIGGTDSTGIDADGDGVFESYLSPVYIKEGAGMQLTVSGDTVEIASTVTGTTNADSLRGLLIQTKTSNLQDNYILKVSIGVQDTTLNWEADQTGEASGTADTFKIVVGATDYSIINNFIKLGFRVGLEVVRGDSAGVDTIYLSVDSGFIMDIVACSLAADTALWHEAYDTLAQWTDAITAFRSMLGDTAKVYCIALDGSNVMSGKLTAQHGILTDSIHTVKLYMSSDIITDFSGAASGLKVNGGLLVIDSVGTGMIANQAVTKEKTDTTDYFRMGGLAIGMNENASWAFLVKGLAESGYPGIAIQETVNDSSAGITFYADSTGDATRDAGIYFEPSNKYLSFKVPKSFLKGQYERLNIYYDSVIAFEPFYAKDGIGVTGNIAVSGTVDDVDISILNANLDTANWITAYGWGDAHPDIGDTINARMAKSITGNTETGIAVTYEAGDSTYDFVAEVTQVEFDKVADDTTALIAAKDSVAAWDNNSTFLLKAGGDVDSIKADTIIVDDKLTIGGRRITGQQHLRFTISDPNAVYTTDHEVCLIPLTEAALTITRIDVTLDADPATEIAFSLKWADAFIGFASAAIIDDTATVAGVTAVTGGFGDATVAAGKCIYLLFDAEPIAAIKQMSVDVTYDFD